jgi:TonB family protein
MLSAVMNRRDPTLLLALLAALAVHGIILAAGHRIFRANLGWELAGSLAQAKPAANLVPIQRPREADDQLGEAKGTGKSINALDGDVPMQSAVADAEQEQAMASRSPSGFGKPSQPHPLVQALQGSTAQKSALAQAPDLTSPPAPRSPKPPPLALVDVKAPPNVSPAQSPLSAGPLAAKPTPPSPAAPQPQQPQQQQNQNQPNDQTQQPQQQQQNPSPASPGGKPEPQADFESTPVTTSASAFVGGRILARSGRKFITRELPNLDDNEEYIELPSMPYAIVLLRLKISATGDVTDVQVEKSCGAEDIDIAAQRAAATWWFEPRIDPDTGKAVPDEIDFSIRFR